jgi:hypothetical protein
MIDIGIMADNPPDSFADLINRFLPEGLRILEVYTSEQKFSNISWIMIKGLLYYDAGASSDTVEGLTDLFAKESIVISKKTKKGISDIDIAPFIKEVCFKRNEIITMTARIFAQNPSINTENLMSAIRSGDKTLIPDFCDFTRTEVFDKDMKVFR